MSLRKERETFAVIERMSSQLTSLHARLAEVEKERDEAKRMLVVFSDSSILAVSQRDAAQAELLEAKAANEELKRDYVIQTPWNQEDEIKEKTWGCGHTNHGSCSQCLGHVTNERNDLLKINERMRKGLEDIIEKHKSIEGNIHYLCQPDNGDVFSSFDAIRSIAYDAALGRKDK